MNDPRIKLKLHAQMLKGRLNDCSAALDAFIANDAAEQDAAFMCHSLQRFTDVSNYAQVLFVALNKHYDRRCVDSLK